MKTTPNAPTIADVQIDLQPVQTVASDAQAATGGAASVAPDPLAIAKQLTEGQRDAMTAIRRGLTAYLPSGNWRQELVELDLIHTEGDATLTPRGVKVADALLFGGDSLADMDAEALRVLVQQLRADLTVKTKEVASVRDQNVTLKRERDDFDKIGKDALSKRRAAESERDDFKKQVEKLTGQLDTARRRADQLEESEKVARRAEMEAKAAAAESGLRAEAAEQRVAELTAPRPGGHIIARNITEAELDALTDEGRKVAHFQFMPDGKLNAVIEPCAPVTQPSRPRNQSMVTPSGLPIPPIGGGYRRPSVPPVPSSNAPRPMPASQSRSEVLQPPTGEPVRAIIVAPKPIDIRPPSADEDKPRIPTFQEILNARLSGQIDASQFTKYANALAGYNAAKTMEAMHS